MKMFLANLSALLVAGLIFTSAYFVYTRFQHWSTQKRVIVAQVNTAQADAASIYRMLKAARIPVDLYSALDRLQESISERRELLTSAREFFAKKPYLPLTQEEETLLRDLQNELDQQQRTIDSIRAAGSPTARPPAPAATAVPHE